jgi:hypothetical protein
MLAVGSLAVGSLFLAACGEKKAPASSADATEESAAEQTSAEQTAAEETAAEQAETVDEPAAAEEPPPPPPPPVNNVNWNVEIQLADGTSMSGLVRRVERSSDWWGEADWLTDASDLKLTLEGYDTEIEVGWDGLKGVTLETGKATDSDCAYSSDYNPWMYTCEVKLKTTATTLDGKKWTVVSRHQWHFVFDDGTDLAFWLYKHPARLQDPDNTDGENYNVYILLQDQLTEELKSTVTSIKVAVQ